MARQSAWNQDSSPIDLPTDPALVLSTIAQVLGVKETGAQPLLQSVQTYLAPRQFLLVLDNFEQVLAAGLVAADLLAASPLLTVLVTSRERLHVRAEHEFVVTPLALPERQGVPAPEHLSQYAAVRLFIDRAQAARPDFQVTNANAPAVAEICARLDGLPLAIELAAARSKLFAPEALLQRLGRRLQLLTGGPRDLPARQQTLRKTIDWSVRLLTPAEQALFARLAVFAGGWTLEAAEAVCAGEDLALDVLDGLPALVDKSLLQPREGAGGEPRFTMLETIRDYALEQLEASGEAEQIRRRHAAGLVALAEHAQEEVWLAAGPRWLDRLQMEQDNVRAALAWALEHDEAEIAVRLAGAFKSFWHLRGAWAEGRTWLERVLPLSEMVHDPGWRVRV